MDKDDVGLDLKVGDRINLVFSWKDTYAVTPPGATVTGIYLQSDGRMVYTILPDFDASGDTSNLVLTTGGYKLYGAPVGVSMADPPEFDSVRSEMGGHTDWVRALLGLA